jgi:L-alanine-DL-glutamate epimerase-like enolase superfamily enzyme
MRITDVEPIVSSLDRVDTTRADVLQPDLARCGGFTVARQIALLERLTAVEIVPHCFPTGVLVAASPGCGLGIELDVDTLHSVRLA